MMKKIKSFVVLFALCVFAILFNSCKKEQPQMRTLEEDCDCAKEVSAEFKMGQYSDDLFKYHFIETDSIHLYKEYQNVDPNFFYVIPADVDFIANLENAISYKWQVGNNSSQQTSRSFKLTFGDTIGTIPVTLMVQAKPNLICNPDDDGYDTVTKYLTLTSFKDFPLKGKYEGYNTLNPNNKYVVEIDTFKNPDQGYLYDYGIKGLIPELDNFMALTSSRKTFSFGGIVNATPNYQNWNYYLYQYNGINTDFVPLVYDRKTKTLTVKYSIRTSENYVSGPYQYFEKITFVGKKIE